MTITVDCRMFDASGVGVYLRGCLPCLTNSENNFLLLGNAEELRNFSLKPNVKVVDCTVKPFSPKEMVFFPGKIKKAINKTDVYYSPFFNIPHGIKIPIFTTIHDIIFPDMPEITSKAGLFIRMLFFRRAYRKSHGIFTVSEFSKSRIEYHLGTEKEIIVANSALGQMFLDYRMNAESIEKQNTIIFIGNIKKHKGLECLLDAFAAARNEGLQYKLIIVGSKDSFRTFDNAVMQKAERLVDSVVFTGFISDEELMERLASASLLVQPSLYEGFCLPPLEALSLGTCALISDIPVLKEVYADFPVTFFKTGDSTSLKEKLLELLTGGNQVSPVLPEKLLRKYTFEKTVAKIMKHIGQTQQ